MRKLVLSRLDVSVPGVTWFGWHVPVALEVLMVAALGLRDARDRDLGVLDDGVVTASYSWLTRGRARR